MANSRKRLENKAFNPMTLKKRLAREIITQLYNQEAAAEAEEHFEKTVQRKEMPEEIAEFAGHFSSLSRQGVGLQD